MVLSRKQCRMLLDSAVRYEERHNRNAANADHRTAKANLETFLAVHTNKVFTVTRSRDVSWFQEWLNSRGAYSGGPLWSGLASQIDFATYC